MNRYFPIDCTKMVLALLIVMIHCQVGFDNPLLDRIITGNGYASGLEDLAVPLFFIFAGFFCAKTADWRKTTSHLIRILLIWGFVSLPLSFHNFLGKTPVEVVQIVLFSGTLSPLWFITALVWCTLIVTAFMRIKWRHTAIAALLIGGFILQSICFDIFYQGQIPLPPQVKAAESTLTTLIYPFIWSFPRGLFLFSAGYCINIYDIRLGRTSAWIVSAALFAFYCFGDTLPFHASVFRLLQMLAYPAVTISFMFLLLSYSRPTPRAGEGRMLREASTLLYLSHMIIRFLFYRASGEEFGWICFTAVIVIFSLGFMLFLKLRQKPQFQWLRYAS